MTNDTDQQLQEPYPSMEPDEIMEIAMEHSKVYNNDSEPLPIKFTEETSHITPKEKVFLNPINPWKQARQLGLSEEESVRMMLDVLSHEIEHYNESDLESKRDFVRDYKQAPKLAGAVMNIVEDLYIDHKRLQRFEGLRKPFELQTEANIDHYKTIDETNKAEACIKTVTYVFRTGEKPDGITTEFFEEFAELCKEKRRETIKADEQLRRQEIAAEIASTIVNELDIEPDDTPDIVNELIEELMEAAERAEERFEWMTEEDKEELQEDIEELAEELDADVPEPEDIEPAEEEEGGMENGSSDSEAEESDSETGESGCGGEQDGNNTDNQGDTDNEGKQTEEEPSEPENSGSSSNEENDGENENGESDREDSEDGNSEDSEDDFDSESGDSENSGDSTAEPGENNSEEEELAEINTEKFRETGVGGGTNAKVPATPKTVKGQAMTETKTDAKELSDEVKEVLKKLEDLEKDTRQINRNRGEELDIKKSIRYMSGDKSSRDIYRKEVRDDPDNRAIGITIDASGSMDGKEMRHALQATGAIGKAAKIIGDDFTANTHWSDVGDSDEAQITGVDWLNRLDEEFTMEDLEGVETRYREPISLGIRKTREELEDTQKRGDRIIFVIHDGNPTIKADGTPYQFMSATPVNEDAVEEVSEEVQKSRGLGYKVIGIAVGKDPKEHALNDMFGKSGWFRFEADELPEKLITIYRNQ